MKWNNKSNEKYTLISIYVIVTAIIIYCLSLVAKNAPIIFGEIMVKINWIAKVTKPIILGFVFAYLLNPIVDFIEKQYKKIKIRKKPLKKCRTLAVFTTIFFVFLFVVGIISLLVFTVTDQLRVANFDDIFVLAESYKTYFDNFYNSVMEKLSNLNIQSEEFADYINTATTYFLNALKAMVLTAVASVTNISSYFTTFIFSLIISIYFMIDGELIKEYMNKVGRALFNDKWNNRIHGFIIDADNVFSGYVRGQLMDALVMMVAISICLSIIGVKFGLIIGVLAGIGNLIPYCGPFVAYAGTILVCLLNGQYKELVIACIVLLIIQTIDGNVIAPKLLSNSIEIHPVLIIIFLIFGSAIGGLLGMLLAVPVGALIKLLFVRFIEHKLSKKAEMGKGKVEDMS
jgi:predicted PurR-regulated permease PerM